MAGTHTRFREKRLPSFGQDRQGWRAAFGPDSKPSARGVRLAAFMDFAAAHEVPPLNYGLAELEQDGQTIAKLRS